MFLAKPSNTLAPFVKQYWGIEHILPNGQHHVQRIVPNGLMELTFYFGDIPESKVKSIPGRSFISGQLSNYYDINIHKNISIFSVTLQPEGAGRLFNLPADELKDANVSLRDLKFLEVSKIEDSLTEAKTFNERIGIIEQFLLSIIHKDHEKSVCRRISRTIQTINQTKGNISVDSLSDEVFLSKKQYERIFRGNIGLSPKKFLSIVRFQNAVYIKQKDIWNSLTDIAYESGYYDQSHMISDFKKLTGKTPKEYFSSGEVFSDYFA